MGARLGEYLGIDKSSLPILLIIDFSKGDDMDKYYFKGNIDVKSIIEFVDNY